MSDELRETFFLECDDLMEVLESGLLDLSNGEGDDETVNAVFRATHSIKGGAGAFGLEALVRFAHKFETTLDEVREKRLEPTTEVLATFLRASDVLSDVVRAMRDETEPDEAAITESAAELSKYISAETVAQEAEAEAASANFEALSIDLDMGGDDSAGADAPSDTIGSVAIDLGDDSPAPDQDLPDMEGEAASDEEVSRVFDISFRPHFSLYQRGNETTLILRELGSMGDMAVVCDVDELPDLDAIGPEDAALIWRVRLETGVTESQVREVFEFVEDDCELIVSEESAEHISAPSAELGQVDLDDIPNGPEEEAALTPEDPSIATEDASAGPPVAETHSPESPAPTPTAGPEEAPQKTGTPAEPEDPAAAKTPAAPKPKEAAAKVVEAPKQTVRVDLDRIERLINLVGELVINQAMLSQRFAESELSQQAEVAEGLDEFRMLTRDIQESVMAIRAQPVKPLFQRMTRIVREAAHATGKTVRLVSEGEATEVDKTIVERLADPLTHMIRNAVDHGLEQTDERVAAGKSAEGVVRLIAAHRSGRIVIEVSDDGAGINREKVREIAVSKGLISDDAALTDAEIDNLLFMPGFSTAKEVSDLSGRGVGMDVVKRAIQALGGRTSITSEPGHGTTFSISLPLTLAVLDGIVVSVAGQTIVIPLTNIVETLRPSPEDVKGLGGDSDVVLVRGAPLPIIDVGHDLGFRTRATTSSDGVFIITETHEGGQHALVVDEIYDQRQVVIKGLDANYGEIPGIAAATILGDGRIALILDVDVIVERSTEAHSAQHQHMAMAG